MIFPVFRLFYGKIHKDGRVNSYYGFIALYIWDTYRAI